MSSSIAGDSRLATVAVTDASLSDVPERHPWHISTDSTVPHAILDLPDDLRVVAQEVWGVAFPLGVVLQAARGVVWAAEHGHGIRDDEPRAIAAALSGESWPREIQHVLDHLAALPTRNRRPRARRPAGQFPLVQFLRVVGGINSSVREAVRAVARHGVRLDGVPDPADAERWEGVEIDYEFDGDDTRPDGLHKLGPVREEAFGHLRCGVKELFECLRSTPSVVLWGRILTGSKAATDSVPGRTPTDAGRPRGADPRPPRQRIDRENNKVIIDGVEHDVSPAGAAYVDGLARAGGERKFFPELQKDDDDLAGGNVTRIWKKLPEPVRSVIEKDERRGARIRQDYL